MKPDVKSFLGRWRIVEMELWDLDYIDLVDEGFIEFDRKGLGSFGFGAIQAQIDYRTDQDTQRIEFTWHGDDEGSEILGRGWCRIDKGKLTGKLFIHLGDESTFLAERIR